MCLNDGLYKILQYLLLGTSDYRLMINIILELIKLDPYLLDYQLIL